MNLNQLSPSVKRKGKKRVGRGPSSGIGKFSGRGNNGQKSRSGASISPSFEGGQTPYFRRIPKKGFSNHPFKKEYTIINLDVLETFYEDGETVNFESLKAKKIIKGRDALIKILGKGTLTKSLIFNVDKISSSAKEKIDAIKG